MIDLHAHILPGLDDGAADWDQALAMCRLAQADGIKTLVATPHYYPGMAPLEPALIEQHVAKLRGLCADAQVELELLGGAEVALDASLPRLAKQGRLPTLGPGGRYFLLEMPLASPSRGLGDLVFQLQLAGLTPIFCHPERTWPAGSDWSWLERLVGSGCLVQVTAMSLTGDFGSQAQVTANRLLEMGCCHLVASDAHSDGRRAPVLSQARGHLQRLMGAEAARLLLEESPRLVLEGQEPQAPLLVSRKRRWFKRRG